MRAIPKSQVDQVVSLLSNGNSIRQVSKKTDLSVGFISKVPKKKLPDRNRVSGGRPPLLTAANKRFCVHKVTRGGANNANKVKIILDSDFGINVSADTVRRALKEAGMGAMEKVKKPLLSKANVRKRLEWAKAHKDWTYDNWKRVVWSDKTKINRFNSDGRTWAWLRDGESLSVKHVKMTVKYGGGNIMLWSAITAAGTGWLCKIDSNMDKELYKSIIEDDLEKTIDYATEKLNLHRKEMIFQHDNDPKHTSKLVTKYLSEQEYSVTVWPPQLPDLNPIENM